MGGRDCKTTAGISQFGLDSLSRKETMIEFGRITGVPTSFGRTCSWIHAENNSVKAYA